MILKKIFSCLFASLVSVSSIASDRLPDVAVLNENEEISVIEEADEQSVSIPDSERPGITFEEEELNVPVGQSVQIHATVVPEDLEIVWSSGNESYATVDQTGKVTGIKAGREVEITANSKDGKYQAICYVNVVEGVRAKGRCGESAYYEVTWEGVLTIYGEGRVSGHGDATNSGEWRDSGYNSYFVWGEYGPDVKTVIIEEGITAIADFVFSSAGWFGDGFDFPAADRLFLRNLKSITIPKSVESIGVYSFSYLFNLEEVNIDENNPAYCADDCFVYTKDRKQILRAFGLQEEFVIPEGVETLATDTFGDLLNLTTIEFPASIFSINQSIVDGAKKFTTVRGYENTVAKEFADKYGYEFISLGICELPDAASVVLDITSLELEIGDAKQLHASVQPPNTPDRTVTWSSSDDSIVTVDDIGIVRAVGLGTAVVTATAVNGVSGSCEVTVIKGEEYVPGLSLNPQSLSLLPGRSYRLYASGYREGTALTWSSSDPRVATVSSNGAVTAKTVGKTVITVEGNGESAQCSVQVCFNDVAHEYLYFYEPVYWAVDNKITVGSGGPNLFSPSAPCTREQFVTFLWRQQGKPAYTEGCSFTDVPESSWYYGPISWAYENGITTGLNDGTGRFGVGQACTREQCVTFLHRAAGSPEPTGSTEFTDSAPGKYYYKPIKWAAGKGITVGLNDGTGRFGVGQKCTRGMLVTFLYRYVHAE